VRTWTIVGEPNVDAVELLYEHGFAAGVLPSQRPERIVVPARQDLRRSPASPFDADGARQPKR
jgi:hypothetical protein